MGLYSTQSFGDIHFGHAELGDLRRTKRLVHSANIMAKHPGGALTEKFKCTKDLIAFYRFCNCPDVTHEAILRAHREATFAQIAQHDAPVLVIHDGTEFDFTTHTSLEKLGQIGNGNRRGYIVQNSLAVNSENREAIGLCNQILHRRANVPKNETSAQRRKRESRESRLWVRGAAALPADWKLVDVCDQGADTFEFLYNECHSGRRFVVRSAHNRAILMGHGDPADCETGYLRDYARQLPEARRWTLQVTSKKETKSPKKKGKKRTVKRIARQATMAVSMAAVQIRPPSEKSGEYKNEPQPMWIVRVWEISPPPGQERLEWFLLTNEPVHSFEDAYRVVGWYEGRWVVEEYHKSLKTGCRIETPQFETEDRLQPCIAVISVVALTLLRLRDASRRPDAKERPATDVISDDYIAVLSSWRHGKVRKDWTIHDFYYALARLGGHLNRKNDHPPGWIVLWRGWQELQAMVTGAEVATAFRKCVQT
jgi:hypothetical protein